MKVWDTVERRQVHQIDIGDTQVQGLGFVDETHLAVVTQDGTFSVYALEVEELVEIVARSITREFTETECERYGFGAACPTLEQLRNEGGD